MLRMPPERENLLKNLPDLDVPATLMPRVLARIDADVRHRARVRFWCASGAALTSVAVFVPALRFALGELAASGFVQYVSLAFSDSGTVLSSLGSFVLALASALPVIGLVLVLSSLFALFSSVVAAARQLPRAFPGRLIRL
jgi:hypothetical protein